MTKLLIPPFKLSEVIKMAFHFGNSDDMVAGEYRIGLHPDVMKWSDKRGVPISLVSDNPDIDFRREGLVGTALDLIHSKPYLMFDNIDDARLFKSVYL